MNKYIFEETQQFLINKFGEEKEDVLPNGLPRRVINVPLNCYKQIISDLVEIFATQNLDLDRYPQYEVALSKFMKEANSKSIDRVKVILSRYKSKHVKESYCAKKQLLTLADELNKTLQTAGFEYNLLADFENVLKCGKGLQKAETLTKPYIKGYATEFWNH